MSTARQRDAHAAHAALARDAELTAKRRAKAERAAAASCAAARAAESKHELRERERLAAAVRERGPDAAAAWAQLEPLLRERARCGNVIAARNATALLVELVPLAPAALPAPAVPPAPPLAAPVDPARPLRVVSLFDGYGGFLIALLLALAKTALTVEVAHAADVSAWKVVLAAAVATAGSAVHLAAPLAADITNAAVYTAAYVASWGAVDLLFAGIPCIFHSPEGRRAGVSTNLRTPACKAIVDGFFRVLSLATARVVVVECSARLLQDPYFETDLVARLAALGYAVAHIVLDANNWLPINRERVFIVCFRSEAAYDAFTSSGWISPPPQREARVDAVLLPPLHPLLPRSCYDAIKSGSRRTLSKAAQAVASLSFVRGKARSAIGVHKRGKFATLAGAAGAVALKGPKLMGKAQREAQREAPHNAQRKVRRGTKRGVLPTLIKSGSGVLRVRDAVGTRSLCARECGALHGVPVMYIEAMLAVASDARVVAALGDGFAIPVVRDLLKAVLRACGWGV